MSDLKGVGIGAGYFSQYHYEAWDRIDNVKIEAICDLDKDKAECVAEEWDIPNVYEDAREMLEKEKPDFVDIITPPSNHFELIKLAADLDSAIICQKPLAPTYEEALSIVEYTRKREVRFMVHENWRFQPWYRKIKAMVDLGEIGDQLHFLNFRMRTGDGWTADAYMDRQPYFRNMPRLLIYETGIHFIDTYRYLAGEVSSVYARLKKFNKEIKGEDAGIVHLNFTSGAMGLYDGNRYNESRYEDDRYTFGEFTVEGSGGTMRLDGDGNLSIQKLGKSIQRVDYNHEKRGFAGDSVFYTQQHFLNGLMKNEPFETNGSNYLRSLKVQEAIYKSAEKNSVIRM
ncbi:Gfo/Idh/MocA family oxidoreductase [Aliifodinibius sp. S!AR15-10]|uniref:Gfo/Idh/MocA family protein n=1 Tax=Aliifodinibius sp. S!AR15-10 TaxID=2950437 RepID=UPI0028623D2B|nr:Gfo/Idh/MocA family oxidoreductase [Aliifodinibius sp. S!AR15-10]MDR8389698.1 Gfo/Idh/MocA family oxidoreductase [Aliifodinibius sp. S!AR15-10]